MDNKPEERNDKKGDAVKLKQIDKQKQALLYSYETLGNLLSSAENFAGLPNEQYEKFNISTAKNPNEMKSEFAWELNCFQMAIKKYKKKYGNYVFPEKYSKEKIINDIKKYIKRTPKDKDKVLYFAMIKIINGEKIDIDFDELFDELDNESESKFDPKKLTKIIGPINSILEDIKINAENGNMAFNEDKSKHKETLKNIKESEPETIKVIVGKKGYLFKLNDSNNEYKFIYEENDTEKTLKIEEEINYKKKKLYLGKYKKENIQIYLNKNEKDYYLCSIFEKEVKEYKKSDIILNDSSNNYGYLKVPIIVYEDLK
jgi:hypothetical protein